MRRAVAVGTCAFVLLFGCSSDNETSPTVQSASSAAATSSTTTTSTTTTTAPPATVPLEPAASAEEAASKFMSAWRQGNALLAATIAVQPAVDAVFSAGDPGSIQARGCNAPPQPPVLCVYRTDPGEVQLRVRPEGDGWIVEQARVSPA